MNRRSKLTRRQFLEISALATAGVVVTACAPKTPEAPTQATQAPVEQQPAATAVPEEKPAATAVPEEKVEEPVAEPVSKYREAPMLAALVASGALPPVDERLPLNPYVIQVREMIGNYGGTIRRGFNGVSDRWGPTKFIDRTLVWLDEDLMLEPRLIESWEVSSDATTYTLHLRKGLKYSDGTELTTADWKWFWDNFVNNSDLQSSPWGKLTTQDEDGKRVLCEASFPDDHTVVYKFAHPNPLFLYGGLRDINGFFTPGAHMKQFHMEQTDDKDALEKAYKDAGFNAWTEYYEDRNWWYLNIEKPMATPWIAKNTLAEELQIMERNPYYFAVDPEGNQLPYVDKISHRLFESPEVFNLWIVNGEIDFQNRHVSIANFTLFKENEASGDYKVFLGISAGHSALQLNLATKEEKLNAFFNNRDVRLAISYAMNRDEVNELIYNGLLVPRQYSPLPVSPNHYPKLSNAHIDYDPAKANQMLDDAGYAARGSDGYRLYPGTSQTISFIIEGTAAPGSSGEDEVQLVVKYLNDIGIKATWKYFERALYTEHFQANEIEAAWWGGDRTVLPLAPGAPIFRGTMIDRPWAAGFGIWMNSQGTDPNAVEPPAGHFIWDIWEIWTKITKEPDPDKQNKLFEQILDIWAEEIPMIGLLGESPSPVIVKNGFRNYLPGQPLDDTSGDEHLLHTESYFWENPEKHT
jgi:peptide/nickel transport system substrate-binding protein